MEQAVPNPLPLTDVSPAALIDVAKPLENQEDVQHTLDTEQRRAAVYGPVLDSTPEQAPRPNRCNFRRLRQHAQGKSPGVLNKHAKRDKQQLANSNSGKGTPSNISQALFLGFHATTLPLYMRGSMVIVHLISS